MAARLLCILLLVAPVSSQAVEGLQAGQVAPSFSLLDLYGRTISLDYFDRHPGVLLFWTTSSPQSAELLEDLRLYQERWGTNDLAIVAVHVEGAAAGTGGLQQVRDLVDRRRIVFPVLLDPGGLTTAAYGVREVPSAVVVDADGRVAFTLAGHSPELRQELTRSLLLAMGRDPAEDGSPAVAGRGAAETSPASARAQPSSCSIPRSRSCTRIHERDPSAADPAAIAVRLCNCYGDVESARLVLSGVRKERLQGPDLRFALAHMMLLKGMTEEARRAFEALRENPAQGNWGEWGLSLVALAEGKAEEAVDHLRAARAGGWSIPEAETAVMRYLEQYWRADRPAPREEQFLALFENLASVRACYRRLGQRG